MNDKKAVRGIVGEHNMGRGPELTLDMPRSTGKAEMYFPMEVVLRHYFMGKSILITEDYEEVPVDLGKLGFISEDQLAKALGVR